MVLCTTFAAQSMNEKISVKANTPHRLHVNFITYQFLMVQWQSEQDPKEWGDPCVSKSGTFSRFFFNEEISEGRQ